MDELRVYVDALFARRGDTAENREMKEEIYGNLAARRDDLIAQGVPEAEAVRAAKAQLPSLDGVLGTVVRTHDFAAVRVYASPYVGNSSNTVNLFYHLPLGDVPARFEIEDDASLCVRYQAALAELDAAKVRRDLVYDSAAAFALIDNLSAVRYAFSDGSYTFTRAQMEAVLGVPLSGLRDGAAMHDQVQAQLEDTEFVASFYVLTQSRPVQAQPVD